VRGEHLFTCALFEDLAPAHDHGVVAGLRHDAEIVSDQARGQFGLSAEFVMSAMISA